MSKDIFQDRRSGSDRRGAQRVSGQIHCRRRSDERRKTNEPEAGQPWWLRTRYVDREMLVRRKTREPR